MMKDLRAQLDQNAKAKARPSPSEATA